MRQQSGEAAGEIDGIAAGGELGGGVNFFDGGAIGFEMSGHRLSEFVRERFAEDHLVTRHFVGVGFAWSDVGLEGGFEGEAGIFASWHAFVPSVEFERGHGDALRTLVLDDSFDAGVRGEAIGDEAHQNEAEEQQWEPAAGLFPRRSFLDVGHLVRRSRPS